jgi:propionyl-CoA carboxylase alpha chain
LQRSEIHGLTTNRDLLVGILRDADFLSGEFDTGYFDRRHPGDLARGAAGDPTLAAVVAAVADAADEHGRSVGRHLPGGWRNLPSQPQRRSYAADDVRVDLAYRWGRDGLVVAEPHIEGLSVVSAAPGEVVVEVAGVQSHCTVSRDGEWVHVATPDGPTALTVVPRFTDPAAVAAPGALVAPMPGSVMRVAVEVGDVVEAGTPLLWLEAMKMEHAIAAPAAGVVTQVVAVGTQVEPGTVLAIVGTEDEAIEPADTTDERRGEN